MLPKLGGECFEKNVPRRVGEQLGAELLLAEATSAQQPTDVLFPHLEPVFGADADRR